MTETNSSGTKYHPIFMFGMERSGTTLMSMMIGAHPDIATPLATTGMWYGFHKRLVDYNGMNSDSDIDRIVDDILAHERIRLWKTDLDRLRIRDSVRRKDFGSVVAACHAEYARVHQKPLWANIDIATLDNMHIANQWFPDARFLHIIRDGRDVALSNQTMPYGAGNIAECAEAWNMRLRTNLRMGDMLTPDRYLAFRYESLILEPLVTLQKICDFLEVPYSEEMLAYEKTIDSRVPDEKIWLWPELKSPPNATKVDRWKKEMSRNQRLVFERTAGPLLRELGYETQEQTEKRFGAYLLELYYFLGRGHRMKRLLQKLGINRRSKLERAARTKERA